jgi:hypothetical protein
MTLADKVKQAGVVGAGGGFPAHVKLAAKADTVIANGAECEPLLHKDAAVMEHFSAQIVKGIASRVDTGMMFVNHPTWTASDLPFGGIKNSGYGRELSSLGIQEFVNKKLVRVASIVAPA